MIATGWIPVALARSIPPGTSAGTRLGEAEIVVWRDTAGAAHAWEDRCPHRGMKMSFGFVRGDHIACLYHGWEYDTSGTCRYIPAHPKIEVPSSICIPRYAVAEAGGMIWVWAPLGSEPGPVPELPAAEGLRSLYIDAAPARVRAVLGVADDTLLRIEIAGQSLVAGLQPVGDARTALHVTLPAGLDAAEQAALARALVALRRTLETASQPEAA